MTQLMITWTDIFEGTGNFFLWVFKGMRVLGHGPNILISLFVIGLLAYWTMRLNRYRKATRGQDGAE
jgi:hypothetical protein